MLDEVSIDQFHAIEMKTALVVECEKIEKSRSLLRIVADIGGEKRQIISSIAEYYTPQEMLGKTIVVVTNLKRAKFMGFESEAMLLAVEKDQFLSLLTADRETPPGLSIT